ncbi:diguanylate cyclase, partial [bacterium]|nr:diguanylate cyclase [bacterium]
MKKPEILVVDDRPENILAMKRLMADLDAVVHTATSGNEALGMVLKHNFALILLDVQMPDMDGFETAEMIRLSDDTAHIPIIFITAINKEEQHIFKGYQCGAVDYLFKPVEAEILLSKVSVFLSLYNQKQELQHLVDELTKSKKLIEEQNEILTRLSIHDDLTGLFNRRHLNTMLEHEFYRCKRYGSNMVVLLLDLDYFKNVNDTHGHKFGDFVLKTFSRRIMEGTRSADLSFRFGGEEFLIILPQSEIEGGMAVGENIRKLCETQLYTEGSVSMQVTTSIGIASFQENSPEVPNAIIAKADEALYQAKSEGRNRVVVYQYGGGESDSS